MRVVASAVLIVSIAGVVVGCSASDRRETAARNLRPGSGGADGTLDGPSSSADRGALVQTVATSPTTRDQMGIITWAIFKKGTVATMYGFDAQGKVKTQVSAATNPDGTEMRIGAPGAGKLHVRKDGTPIANTLDPRKINALAAMRADTKAAKGEAAYAYCVDPYLDFDDVLDRIGGVYDCYEYPDGYGWCEQPVPMPAVCSPVGGYAPVAGYCDIGCPPGSVFAYPCDCVDAWDDWGGWDYYDW